MSNHRNLTLGEISLAKQIFKNSINYSSVKVFDRKYVFFQPKNSGMTPNGNIHMSDGAFLDDYSKLDTLDLRAFFINEMGHVWQYQCKILNPICAAISEIISHGFNYSKAYFYKLETDKDLLDYNLEQQAAIIEDYYLLHVQNASRASLFNLNLKEGQSLQSVKNAQKLVLAKFLKDPSYISHNVSKQKNNQQIKGFKEFR